FLQEAQDLLEQLEQTLLDLTRNADDTDLLNTAFRAMHTIKGSGAMFGFDALTAFTHHVETAFDLVRKGKLKPTPALMAVALAAKDQMRALIEQPATENTAAGEAILTDLQRQIGSTDTATHTTEDSRGDAAPVPASNSGWIVRFRLPSDAMAAGTNPLLLLDELRGLG